MYMRNAGGDTTAGMPFSVTGNVKLVWGDCAVSGLFCPNFDFLFGVGPDLLFGVMCRAAGVVVNAAACATVCIGVQAKYERQHGQ